MAHLESSSSLTSSPNAGGRSPSAVGWSWTTEGRRCSRIHRAAPLGPTPLLPRRRCTQDDEDLHSTQQSFQLSRRTKQRRWRRWGICCRTRR
ncbi:hypothetical protein E2562_036071 [Oryza meyeriana var. granulata]|uniref:Uncharacterized protein n=1 Tax=Oryza meyeriana var. granulata TaxID=110450 RepID=A0A6G1CX78_9ORYZ|nr:hypothetical protein E2562_036071 [Oryza meyeriana var. granulata]KAF0904670.1 hypothetical protein E2562_036071 [Oryza meyeriana var. granulata]